jgi:hypothetical protein
LLDIECKVVLLYACKVCRGIACVAALNFKLGFGCSLVVSFKPRPVFPQDGIKHNAGGPQIRSGYFGDDP